MLNLTGLLEDQMFRSCLQWLKRGLGAFWGRSQSREYFGNARRSEAIIGSITNHTSSEHFRQAVSTDEQISALCFVRSMKAVTSFQAFKWLVASWHHFMVLPG